MNAKMPAHLVSGEGLLYIPHLELLCGLGGVVLARFAIEGRRALWRVISTKVLCIVKIESIPLVHLTDASAYLSSNRLFSNSVRGKVSKGDLQIQRYCHRSPLTETEDPSQPDILAVQLIHPPPNSLLLGSTSCRRETLR